MYFTTRWPDASRSKAKVQDNKLHMYKTIQNINVCACMCAPFPSGPGGLPRPLMSARALCAHTDNASPAGAHLQPLICQGCLHTSLFSCVAKNLSLYSRVTGPRARQDPGSGYQLPSPYLPPAAGSTHCVGDAGSRLWIPTALPRISLSSPLGVGGRVSEGAGESGNQNVT